MPRYRRRISMRKTLKCSSERGGGERFINLLVYFDDEIIEVNKHYNRGDR